MFSCLFVGVGVWLVVKGVSQMIDNERDKRNKR